MNKERKIRKKCNEPVIMQFCPEAEMGENELFLTDIT